MKQKYCYDKCMYCENSDRNNYENDLKNELTPLWWNVSSGGG